MSAELNRIDKRTRELKVLNICLEELEELGADYVTELERINNES